jgi:cysteine synthase A
MKIYENNSLSIGNTPLVALNRLGRGMHASIVAKIEGRNPAYSVKCRIGAAMIEAAEHDGFLKPGSRDVTVVEPTSGNSGIALAFVCAARGYPLLLTMPDTMSIERRRMLAGFGARLELTDGAKGMKEAVARAEEIAASDLKRYFMPQQFKNPANPEVHVRTTGPEIGRIPTERGHFRGGSGHRRTITGVSRTSRKSGKKTSGESPWKRALAGGSPPSAILGANRTWASGFRHWRGFKPTCWIRTGR